MYSAKCTTLWGMATVSPSTPPAIYGQSEEMLGHTGAGKRFTTNTSTRGGFIEEGATKQTIIKEAQYSKAMLKVDQV